MNIDALTDAAATELTEYVLKSPALLRVSTETHNSVALKKAVADRFNAYKNKVAENQFEKDCRAACDNCAADNIPFKEIEWFHCLKEMPYPMVCLANNMRNRREQETRITNR